MDTKPPRAILPKCRFWVTCLELDLKICTLSQTLRGCRGCCSPDHTSRARLCTSPCNTVATSQIKYNSKFTFSVTPATFQHPPYCTEQNKTLSPPQKALRRSSERDQRPPQEEILSLPCCTQISSVSASGIQEFSFQPYVTGWIQLI